MGAVTDVFVPALQPPDSPLVADALWFHVRGNNVWVAESAADVEAEPVFVGMLGTTACWAVEMPTDAPDPDDGMYSDLRALYGRLPEVQWTVAGRAVQLVDWVRTHRFCGRCATATERSTGERSMRCPRCGLLAFPRLAPAD